MINPDKQNLTFLKRGPKELVTDKIEKEVTSNPLVKEVLAKHFFVYKMLMDVKKSDRDTFDHVLRVAKNILNVIKNSDDLNDNNIEDLVISGLVHDAGKTDKDIVELVKEPRKLTASEEIIVQKHPRKVFDWLKNIGRLDIAEIVVQHHELSDDEEGRKKSYPRSNGELKPEVVKERAVDPEVTKLARVLAVCDVFDALISERPYKESFPIDKCKTILRNKFRKNEDQKVIDILVNEYKKNNENF